MFEEAISKNSTYTYPIIIGALNQNLECLVATMININNNGDFLTCKHVTEELKKYFNFQNSKEKNEFKDMSLIFPFPIEQQTKINIIEHNKLDISIIHFENLKTNLSQYPVFSKKTPKSGKSICKLGYAFPNGNPFEIKDNHLKLSSNSFECPLFPYDGMVTRNVNLNIDNELYENAAFETSSAGLKGQSGGPIFDAEGTIYGIQSMNITMPLDTIGIVKKENNQEIYPQFINFGVGISTKEIIKLFETNNIEYQSK